MFRIRNAVIMVCQPDSDRSCILLPDENYEVKQRIP